MAGAPADAGSDAAAAEGEEVTQQEPAASIDELEQRLLASEGALLDAGIELPDAIARARVSQGMEIKPSAASSEGADPNRCVRICELQTNICELRDLICTLADDHADEDRYEQACERSTLDCERAEQACTDCDG